MLGMHRSGTSAATRVLGLCGGALPRQALVQHESNLLGHWEPTKIVETHDRFLAEAGTAWDDQMSYPRAIFETTLADAYRQRLVQLARSTYGEAPLFILKDPRISRLVRLWQPVLAALDAAPHAVIVLRNPLEVAASLKRRDGWDEYRALMVWTRYMLSAERDTRGMPRCFVHYDQIMDDWRTAVATISIRLGIVLAAKDQATAQAVDRFVRQDLRHHRQSEAEFLLRGDIADCVKQVYRCCRAATDRGSVDHAALDAVDQSLNAAERLYRNAALHGAETDRRAVFIDRQNAAQRRDALFGLAMAEMGRLRDSAEQSQRRLDMVLKTRSWRLTRPFRGVSYIALRLARALSHLFVAQT